MRSKQIEAIQIFEKHKAKLDLQATKFDAPWASHLADLIRLYIGPDSSQLNTFKAQAYSVLYHVKNSEFEFNPAMGARLVDSYIDFVKNNGVYKDTKSSQNFLGTLGNEALISLLGLLLTASCTAAYLLGVNNSTPKQEEKSQEILNNSADDGKIQQMSKKDSISTLDTTTNKGIKRQQ